MSVRVCPICDIADCATHRPSTLPAVDLSERIEQLNERLTAATDDAKEAEAYAEQLEAKLTKAVEALREFAKQKRITEMDVDEYDQADIEGAYCQFIFKARAVLAELEGTK